MALFTENALNMTNLTRLTVFASMLTIFASGAGAQQPDGPKFGGPDAVENQLAEDKLTWNERRNEWKDKYGFGVSFDYTSVVLSANETFSDSTGAGGIARFYGAWDLVGEGSRIARLEVRASPRLRQHLPVRLFHGPNGLRRSAGTAV